MDPAGGDGVPFGVNLRTATRQTTQADTAYNGAKQDDSRQNPGTGTEVGDTEGQTPTGPVYQPDLPSPQEGRIAATSGQSEAAELFDGKMQFKMESARTLKDLVRRNDWMVSIDMKDAYLSVPIEEGGRKYLRFAWEERVYEFQCLPFGLSSAPRVFTKLLKPVMALLRQRGLRSMIFLDDMLLMAESRQDLERQSQEVLALLRLLGFRINWGKSQLLPTHKLVYLGLTIDTTVMTLTLPEEKVLKILKRCLYYVVAGGSRVCISPVLRNRQMPTESVPGGVYSGSGDPRVGRPALVSGPAGPPNTIPSAIAVTRSAPSGSLQQGTPTSATRSTPASRLETIRETHLAEGILEQTSELIRSGWSKGTNTVYQSG